MKNTIYRRLGYVVCYILSIHILALCFLTAVRILHLTVNAPAGLAVGKVIHGMMIGLKFDNVVLSYITALPLLTLGICSMLPIDLRRWLRGFGIFYSVLISIVIAVAIADIPYYRFFNNHLNWDALSWLQFFSNTAGMMLGEKSFYVYFILAIVVIALFVFLAMKITSFFRTRPQTQYIDYTIRNTTVSVLVWLVLCGICFIGIRGSLQRYPISVGFAAFTDNVFVNRLGVNPLFNILESSKYNVEMPQLLMDVDAEEAINYVQQALHREGTEQNPLQSTVEGTVTDRPNIIVILMESMTKWNMSQTYNGEPITPYLLSLYSAPHCMSFDNCYSAGIHTNNGITATMFGYTPNFAKTTMPVPPTQYAGLSYNLHQAGYTNLCFVTSNPQYDNMNGTLLENDFDRIYSQYDYPADKVVNNFGVQDDYMFSFGLERMQEQTEPFMAMFLTVSNHAPYIYPAEFEGRGKDASQRTIAYADDAIRKFIDEAQQTEAGRDAYYVLISDHGAPVADYEYEMVYEYNHIVWHILSSRLDSAHTAYDGIAGQVDVAPTVLSLIGLPYTNNTMGNNLLTTPREMIQFVSNECLGCVDKEYFWCYNIQTNTEYLYRIGSETNILSENPEQAAKMKEYATKMQWVNTTAVKQGWTKP